MKEKVVLYVDDDSDDIMILQGMFDAASKAPQLISLSDSEQALDKISEIKESGKELCLILLDINMPRLDGKDLAQTIKEQDEWSSIPIAFISTSTSPGDISFAATLQAPFFAKPNSIEGMKDLAEEIINHCLLM